MARARNIKPALFSNDLLADVDPIGRLLFIGLWTICDYKGNLEFRAKKIKAALLPYDNCDINKLAINLEQSGFIQSYSNDGVIYISVVNFSKHQNPHKNERDKGTNTPSISDNGSQLFDLNEGRIKSDKIEINPDNDGTNRADSLILNPDSSILIPSCKDVLVQPEAKPSKFKFDSYQMEFAKWMLSKLLILNPNFKKPNLDSWANTLRLMIEVDKRDPVLIGKVFEWANQDEFWSSNILSANSLRKQFDKLVVKVNQPQKAAKVSMSGGGDWAKYGDETF